MTSASAPPMTTMASGFWVSEPIPRERAAGKSPSMATEVGHQDRAQPALGCQPGRAFRRLALSSRNWRA